MKHRIFLMMGITVFAVMKQCLLVSPAKTHEIQDMKMSQLEYLYARHDDDRLVKIACAKALNNDAHGAFYLGAVLAEPESLYFKPRTAYLWLSIAKDAGYRIADSFIQVVFPYLSSEEITLNVEQVRKCRQSNFSQCLVAERTRVPNSVGWPPQTKFICNKNHNREKQNVE